MKNMDISDRIMQLLKEEDLTSSKFASILDVQASSISHIISGRNKPSLDFLQKVLTNFKDINASWLILGNGSMYKSMQHRQTQINFDALEECKNKKANPLLSENESREQIEAKENMQKNNVKYKKNIKKIIVFYSDNTFEEFKAN